MIRKRKITLIINNLCWSFNVNAILKSSESKKWFKTVERFHCVDSKLAQRQMSLFCKNSQKTLFYEKPHWKMSRISRHFYNNFQSGSGLLGIKSYNSGLRYKLPCYDTHFDTTKIIGSVRRTGQRAEDRLSFFEHCQAGLMFYKICKSVFSAPWIQNLTNLAHSGMQVVHC